MSVEMRVAIPTWQGIVSPVFDVARCLLLVDVEAGRAPRRRLESLTEGDPLARAGRLKRLSVDVLLCGAVSSPIEQMLLSAGIQVIPFVCGNVDEILRAYLSGRLRGGAFLMPGCGGRRRRWAGGRGGAGRFGPRGGMPPGPRSRRRGSW